MVDLAGFVVIRKTMVVGSRPLKCLLRESGGKVTLYITEQEGICPRPIMTRLVIPKQTDEGAETGLACCQHM